MNPSLSLAFAVVLFRDLRVLPGIFVFFRYHLRDQGSSPNSAGTNDNAERTDRPTDSTDGPAIRTTQPTVPSR